MGTEEPKTFKLVVMLILDPHHPLEGKGAGAHKDGSKMEFP